MHQTQLIRYFILSQDRHYSPHCYHRINAMNLIFTFFIFFLQCCLILSNFTISLDKCDFPLPLPSISHSPVSLYHYHRINAIYLCFYNRPHSLLSHCIRLISWDKSDFSLPLPPFFHSPVLFYHYHRNNVIFLYLCLLPPLKSQP